MSYTINRRPRFIRLRVTASIASIFAVAFFWISSASATGASEVSPEEAIKTELELLENASRQSQDAEIEQEASQSSVSSYQQRKDFYSARQQARLEKKEREQQQLAASKADATQSAQTARGGEAIPDVAVTDSALPTQVRALVETSSTSPTTALPAIQTPSNGTLANLSIAFQLDNSPSSTSQIAENWVPRISGVLEREFTVVAKVEGHDAAGAVLDIDPVWTPADPSTVAVSPGRGRVVKITVRGVGASNLTVAASGVSKDLWILAAREKTNALKVEILQ